MRINILTISIMCGWLSIVVSPACSQSFFWSSQGPDSITRAPVADAFTVNSVFKIDTFYLYFRNSQEVDTSVSVIITAAPSMSILSADTFDFPVRVGGIQIDTRLGKNGFFGPGEINNNGQEAIIQAARFGPDGFGLANETTGPIFVDDGYVPSVDAFLFATVTLERSPDFEGDVEIVSTVGPGGVFHQGMPTAVTFGSIRVNDCPRTLSPGDINDDQVVDLRDVAEFVDVLATGVSTCNSDINEDGITDLLDLNPFIDLLIGN